MIYTTDNNAGNCHVAEDEIDNLLKIANRPIEELLSEHGSEIWLFPQVQDRYGDRLEKECIFTLDGERLTTGNVMGFIGYGGTEVTIHSRFSSTYKNDFFMQYLLQKVFAINIFDLSHSKDNAQALDMAILLFPYFLKKALLQGLYREYRSIDYNDEKVRGAIDFNRHIRLNYPFLNVRVAYSTREYRYDNSVTQLVRHTIEFIKANKQTAHLLFANKDIRSYVQTIVNATPSYKMADLPKVISKNLRPKVHPYFSEYLPLQRLCLQILRHEKISYGTATEKIHGVLFDGAWLWEEYLNVTMSKVGFTHPKNKERIGGVQVYANRRGVLRYPDYMHEEIIADAKYKRLYRDVDSPSELSIPRDDLNQMIAYLHITGKQTGIFICPSDRYEIPIINGEVLQDGKWNLMYDRYGVLAGQGGQIHVISLNIPQSCKDYPDFYARMQSVEVSLESKLRQVIAGTADDNEYSFA